MLITAYLDGELDGDEARRLEVRLHEPEIAATLSRELALRDWLQQVGPEAPPEELNLRLEVAVTSEAAELPSTEEREPARFPALQAALAGMSWMARGPAMALSTQGLPVYGASEATLAFRSVGYAVAPLTSGRKARKKKPVSKKRRLGSLAWKLLQRK